MKARRTPWWQFALAAALGLLAGIGLASYGESSGLSLIGAPWVVAGLLAVLGLLVLIMALQVHKYANTDPKKRPHSFVNPTVAVYTLVLAKALGLAGAALSGWYVGQILMSIGHFEAPFYHDAVIECAVSAVICIADMIIGIIGEWLCQLPPNDGPESAKLKQAKNRQDVAQAFKQ
ncbi:DUF3180 domain-containing protein [Bifidobacterium callitrichidarum]|uniref:DUF3180 domain-containing protein n=1 Tax=Bifidobacterium callitrichidarum TaxID=2052941 RepID=A0A2U2N3C9_9BIFI|nr:DUF3180 domain-containing protein [Bifidobacterium callitrichidarum]PWG63610.1 DUF3180 domain-containing protein [Bifidobacterium callitrichidarum]